jgi:hypothetical protein
MSELPPLTAADLADLLKLHQNTTQGLWGQRATSHNTVAKNEGRPDYRIADFHHASDASFVDAAHKYMPTLIAIAQAREADLKVMRQALEATQGLIVWDKARGFPVPYRIRDPIHAIIEQLRAATGGQP